MAVERYQPISLLQQFNNEINRMFMRDTDFPALSGGQWRPAVDIRETDDAYVIEAEIPGVDPKEIDITLHQGTLTLKGERQAVSETEQGNARYRERSYGQFVRRFSLPDTADEDNIEALAEQGVLKLSITKKAQSKPRRIEVKSQ